MSLLFPVEAAVESGEFALLQDFAIIMAVAGGSVVAFRLLKQPPILGYLVAGVLIGPFTFPNPPVENTDTIRLLAELGLIILLFALGLEFGLDRLRRVGLRVIVIALMEMGLMIALGYELGTLLGWTGKESVFLGSAMAITSSAIVGKMLRDAGRLDQPSGRTIVGILVMEDLVAVILLTVLSGVATIGTSSAGDVGALVLKLVLFTLSALVIGALLAPRTIGFIARYGSDEILLLASLAMCFGLALIAQELDISAAAGAFLIGTVLGDTRHSEHMSRITSPIRDLFGAIFFISIGMLVDIEAVVDHIWVAIVISVVFILGTLIANSIGAFVTGHDGRTSLQVGAGMTQMGEFSLAMVKVGSDQGAVGAFMYPVIAVSTAVISFLYPFVFRIPDPLTNLLERRSPRMLRQYFGNVVDWLAATRSALGVKGEGGAKVQYYSRLTLVNVGVIMILLGVGTVTLRFTDELADLMNLKENVVGLIVGSIVLALIVPPALGTWFALRRLTDGVAEYILKSRAPSGNTFGRNLGIVLRDSLLLVFVIILTIWSLPFLSQLLFIGSFSAPLVIVFLVLLIGIGVVVAFKIHRVLALTFSRTFLGQRRSDLSDEEDKRNEGR